MKIADKLRKVGDSITINIYDNGFMVEVSGRDNDDDYTQAKIICSDLAAVNAVIKEAVEMEKS